MPTNYQSVNNLKVSKDLLLFINNELFEDLEIDTKEFWVEFDKVVHELAPINKKLLKVRESLQKEIDNWHIKNKGNQINLEDYKKVKEIPKTYRRSPAGSKKAKIAPENMPNNGHYPGVK